MSRYHQLPRVFAAVLTTAVFAVLLSQGLKLIPDLDVDVSPVFYVVPFLLVVGFLVLISAFLRLLLERFTDYRGLSLFAVFTDILWGYVLTLFLILFPAVMLGNLIGLDRLSQPLADFLWGLAASLVIAWQLARRYNRELRDTEKTPESWRT